jgi:hypothetical protein
MLFLLLTVTGCLPTRAGIDVPVTVTATLDFPECGAMKPTDANGTSCVSRNPVFQVQGPLGDFGYAQTFITTESVMVSYMAIPYIWLRDAQVDCNGEPRHALTPETGDTMTTSLRITAVRDDGTRIEELTWDAWLDGGNPAKQAVSYSLLENGDLCLVVSSVRYTMANEADHGVGPIVEDTGTP